MIIFGANDIDMKKIFTLISLIGLGYSSQAQTVAGADMETWKSYTSFSVSLERPDGWACSDSLISYYYFLTGGSGSFSARITKSSTVKHGGSFSAKLVTSASDTFPSILANSGIKFDPADVLAGKYIFKYTGGTAVSKRILWAHAYIQYSTTSSDEGTMSVQAIKVIGGKDSVVGKGTTYVPANTSFTKVSTGITYVDATVVPERLIISFVPTKKTAPAAGNTMYVDDVTISDPVGIETPVVNDKRIVVYPNPATHRLHIDASALSESVSVRIFNALGQFVSESELNGSQDIDITALSPGNYVYVISGSNDRKYHSGPFIKE